MKLVLQIQGDVHESFLPAIQDAIEINKEVSLTLPSLHSGRLVINGKLIGAKEAGP